jgi:hypothetical protein
MDPPTIRQDQVHLLERIGLKLIGVPQEHLIGVGRPDAKSAGVGIPLPVGPADILMCL